MTIPEVRIQDNGTVFVLNIEEDGSAADLTGLVEARLYFVPPDGVEFSAVATADGSSISATLSNDELDQLGLWDWGGYLDFGGSSVFRTEVVQFRVDRAIGLA